MGKLDTLFDHYKSVGIKAGGDPTEDSIQLDGVVQYLEDLQVDMQGVEAILVGFLLQQKDSTVILREEFKDGWERLRADSLESQRAAVAKAKASLSSERIFRDFYQYAFTYSKDPLARFIAVEIAVPVWHLVLEDRYPLLDTWCDFIENVHKKSISRDTWDQFYRFIETIGTNFSTYDPEAAWPTTIDLFVEHCKTKEIGV